MNPLPGLEIVRVIFLRDSRACENRVIFLFMCISYALPVCILMLLVCIRMLLVCIRMLFVCSCMLPVCIVTRMYPFVSVLPVCYSYILVCTRMYPCVTLMLPVFYPYVLVWCLSQL